MCSILKLHSFWERERECGARLATPCELARLGSSCKPATCRRRRRTSGHGLLRAAPPVKHDALPDLCLRRTTIFYNLELSARSPLRLPNSSWSGWFASFWRRFTIRVPTAAQEVIYQPSQKARYEKSSFLDPLNKFPSKNYHSRSQLRCGPQRHHATLI